jgi:hypothetical protein
MFPVGAATMHAFIVESIFLILKNVGDGNAGRVIETGPLPALHNTVWMAIDVLVRTVLPLTVVIDPIFNVPPDPGHGKPPSFTMVVELNIVQSPGVIGPMTVTFCASDAAMLAIRIAIESARRFMNNIPR